MLFVLYPRTCLFLLLCMCEGGAPELMLCNCLLADSGALPVSVLRDLALSVRKPGAVPHKLPTTQRGRPLQFPWLPKVDVRKNYTCEVCGKQFYQQQHYLGHRNVHFGLRPFKCKICEVGFPYQSQLAAHRKSCKETGDGASKQVSEHRCEICSKSFNEHFKLVKHMVQIHHMAGAQFTCPCGAKFGWRAAFKSHCSACPKSSPLDKS